MITGSGFRVSRLPQNLEAGQRIEPTPRSWGSTNSHRSVGKTRVKLRGELGRVWLTITVKSARKTEKHKGRTIADPAFFVSAPPRLFVSVRFASRSAGAAVKRNETRRLGVKRYCTPTCLRALRQTTCGWSTLHTGGREPWLSEGARPRKFGRSNRVAPSGDGAGSAPRRKNDRN
jgi:hypothetical protein